MFRKLIAAAIVISAIAAGCKSNNTNETNNAGEGQSTTTVATPRDWSINKDNAYNDLFLDSSDVAQFIAQKNLDAAHATAIRAFYNTRNYEFAWFASTGLVEQGYSFHSLYATAHDTDAVNKSLERQMNKIRDGNDTVISAKDPSIIKIELELTARFIQYATEHFKDVNIASDELGNYIPARRMTAADMIAAYKAGDEKNEDASDAYNQLRDEMLRYRDIVKNGGWPALGNAIKKIKAGKSAPAVTKLKKRLQISGELPGNDTTALFTPELRNAIKTFQTNHNDKPTGIVNAALIKQLNIPAAAVLQQILVNMQRMKWMPIRPKGKLIIVNIPEFELYVDSSNVPLFKMDVVVGAEGHNTTMFSGRISQVVFSPYWDVPPSIVKKEILPGIARDKNYLEQKDMEITGHEDGLPVVRQKPGKLNALGKVKFLFPNTFNIYLHDSPEKSLFSRSQRSLSHGCIRLSDAPKMAYFLLENYDKWPREKINSAMNSGIQQFVYLKPSVPVVITYYTAWVANGALHFATDIYGHDAKIAAKLFANPQIH